MLPMGRVSSMRVIHSSFVPPSRIRVLTAAATYRAEWPATLRDPQYALPLAPYLLPHDQALESDTRVLAYEAGQKYQVRVNTISAGPLGSRAARAIGFIDDMIRYSYENAPIQKELSAQEVGNVAAFLCSPLASAITGTTVYVDNGLSTMGLARDSKALERPSDT